MIAVESSNLNAVGYDGLTGTLAILFHSGGLYEYYSVPTSQYFGLMSAGSHGKYFHRNIKNRYRYRRIR